MLIADFIENIRGDFENVAELAGPETAPLIERLGATLAPAFQKHLYDALNLIVQEFNVGDSAPLAVGLDGGSIRLTRLVSSEDVETPAPSPSDYSARIALRLSDDLKESIEHLATDVGSSVNSWIVRSLERTVRTDPTSSRTSHRQLRGRGRA